MDHVSVIIPARNAVATISRAIRSALHDGVTVRVVVADDGSTDATAAKVTELADDRVRLVSSGGVGPMGARLAALSAAKGEWVTFLDADDTLSPGSLERCLRCARQEGADIVQLRMINRLTPLALPYPGPTPQPGRELDALLYDERLWPINMAGKLYRRNLVEEAAKGFDYTGVWGEDRLINLDIFSRHPRTVYLPSARYNYFWSSGMTKGAERSHWADIKEVYRRKHERYPAFEELMQAELMRMLHHELRRRADAGEPCEEWLEKELATSPWVDMPTPASAGEVLTQAMRHRWIKRMIKKIIY